MRIMGLDYGSKTIGVSISDPLGFTAQPIETITRKDENKLRKSFARIEELIEEYKVQEVVLGLPLNMDGSMGERSIKTLEFKEKLEKRIGLDINLWDERLTTKEAEAILFESGVRKENHKKYIDQIAANFILDEYMKSKN